MIIQWGFIISYFMFKKFVVKVGEKIFEIFYVEEWQIFEIMLC